MFKIIILKFLYLNIIIIYYIIREYETKQKIILNFKNLIIKSKMLTCKKIIKMLIMYKCVHLNYENF